ncbi:MAG: endonuclease domain-containing protein [Bacteroidaceae bacterium]|nr:endonuclease domain-containing protein [Bacteroidaceae bacterium]
MEESSKIKAEDIQILVADESHERYVDTILKTIEEAAKVRGTGIAKRTHEYVATKMREAKAVIALAPAGEGQEPEFAGFSYIETWGNKQYVTTSGLIVNPQYRGLGIAKKIKDMTFSLARIRWPHAKIFSLTSGAAVMKMNTQLGYQPVTFDDLTDDEAFWKGCEGCVNVEVLRERNRKFCICTAMLFDPEEHLPAKIPQEVINRINKLEAPYCPPEGDEQRCSNQAKGKVTGPNNSDAVFRKPLYQTADCSIYGKLKELATENRKNPTQAETVLWEYLKEKRLGVPFRRQQVIGQFIADFACLQRKLVVEVDGGYHQLPEQQVSDKERTSWLQAQGLRVVRFTNDEVIGNIESVINSIKESL